jgi:hypothetical protein
MGKKLLSKCRTEMEELAELTSGFSRDIEENIEKGKTYLDDVVSHITDYKTA